MENEYAKHEKDYIKQYQAKGYDVNFRFEKGRLIASESKKSYEPNEVLIVAEHRYEGMSNPSDMSILYVLETDAGEKGTYLMGYGPNTNMEAAEFFKSVPEENSSNHQSTEVEE